MFKRFLSCFFVCAFAAFAAHAAVTINKADPVQTTKSSGSAGVTSFVPTVIELATGVISLNQQQNLLTKDCEPSPSDINFVDNMVKKWAETGQQTAEQMGTALKRKPCSDGAPTCYSNFMQFSTNTPGVDIPYDRFDSPADKGKIWQYYPKVGSAYVCKKGANCTDKEKDMVTDMYDIFYLIGFGPADYLPTEATMAAKIIGKMETCSKAKLDAKKKALWGEFISKTAGGIGKSTNTGNIMDQIGGIVQSGSGGMGLGALSSVGGIATQMMGQ